MREIEGVAEARAILHPHWAVVDSWFLEQNRRFLAMMNSDHDTLGRVLKSHLVVETFLTEYWEHRMGAKELQAARLSFHQKASMLPSSGSGPSLVKPGLLKLNGIRNRLGHNPCATFTSEELGSINDVLSVARPNVEFPGPVERLEAFAAVACAFLLVAPPELQKVFDAAFAKVRAGTESE